MFSGRQFDARLGLSRPEVKMRLVLRDRLFRIERVFHIDQQMVVAGVGEMLPACVTPMLRRPKRHQNAPLMTAPSAARRNRDSASLAPVFPARGRRTDNNIIVADNTMIRTNCHDASLCFRWGYGESAIRKPWVG